MINILTVRFTELLVMGLEEGDAELLPLDVPDAPDDTVTVPILSVVEPEPELDLGVEVGLEEAEVLGDEEAEVLGEEDTIGTEEEEV